MRFNHSPGVVLAIAVLLFALGGWLTMDMRGWFRADSTPERTSMPAAVQPGSLVNPRIVLQRLRVSYWGQDGQTVIGSGCPGVDGQGSLVDYHLTVEGVNPNRKVTRILVSGDNSTLTWEWPCSGTTWGLYAVELGQGNWDIFIAPSEPTRIYTIIFFYDDQSMAMGMVSASP